MRLLGPHAVLGTLTEADYALRQAAYVRGRGVRTEDARPRADAIVAYVNEGRWVADCPDCNAGMSVDKEWAARCYGCGAVYGRPVFPDEADAIEDVLAMRKVSLRNWRAEQTVADLANENIAAGLDVPDLVP